MISISSRIKTNTMTLSCAGWRNRLSKGACGWAFAPIGCVIAASALDGSGGSRVSEVSIDAADDDPSGTATHCDPTVDWSTVSKYMLPGKAAELSKFAKCSTEPSGEANEKPPIRDHPGFGRAPLRASALDAARTSRRRKGRHNAPPVD